MNVKSLIDDRIHFYEVPKRVKPKMIPLMRVGNFLINVDCRQVTINGEKIQMRGKTFDAFFSILKREGAFVSYEELFKEVFPDKKYSRYSSWASVSIHRVRNIFGENVVITEYNKGYRLNLEYGQ